MNAVCAALAISSSVWLITTGTDTVNAFPPSGETRKSMLPSDVAVCSNSMRHLLEGAWAPGSASSRHIAQPARLASVSTSIASAGTGRGRGLFAWVLRSAVACRICNACLQESRATQATAVAAPAGTARRIGLVAGYGHREIHA